MMIFIAGSSDSLTVERGYKIGDPGYKLAFNVFSYNVKKCFGQLDEVFIV